MKLKNKLKENQLVNYKVKVRERNIWKSKSNKIITVAETKTQKTSNAVYLTVFKNLEIGLHVNAAIKIKKTKMQAVYVVINVNMNKMINVSKTVMIVMIVIFVVNVIAVKTVQSAMINAVKVVIILKIVDVVQ